MDADNAVAQATAVPPVEVRTNLATGTFVGFYRQHYRSLMATVMYFGATQEQADEAAQFTMHEVMKNWYDIAEPLAWARRAVLHNFYKGQSRGLDRTRVRQVRRGAGTPAAREDQGLSLWEDRQWVRQGVDPQPPAQRTVMAYVVDGFTPAEIADKLGRSSAAVRQSLCEARKRLTRALENERAAEHAAGALRKEAR